MKRAIGSWRDRSRFHQCLLQDDWGIHFIGWHLYRAGFQSGASTPLVCANVDGQTTRVVAESYAR